MTKVAIATINWNGKKDTLEFLESLKKLDTSPLVTRTFVVSNEKLEGDFELIYKKENRGSAGGYNDGIKAALAWGAQFILLVNNDVLIKSSDLLLSLLTCFTDHPTAGAVSPKIYFAPGFEYKKCKVADRGNILWYAGGDFDWNNINSSHRGIDEIDSGKYDRVEETGFVSGSAMLVKRAVFDQKIFWDENLFAYCDDNDFQEKMRLAGFKLFYDGKVSIYHKVSQTSGVGSPISDYYLARNRLIFGMRYAPIRTKFALLRQGATLLLIGRKAQKEGVRDFLMGKRGELKN